MKFLYLLFPPLFTLIASIHSSHPAAPFRRFFLFFFLRLLGFWSEDAMASIGLSRAWALQPAPLMKALSLVEAALTVLFG